MYFVLQVKKRKDGHKKQRERPRTVHIDVYCTASESENENCSEASVESDESNTSSCYTVVKANPAGLVRHTRKKNSLPHRMKPKDDRLNATTLKPVLSYRISAKELADAVERKHGLSKTLQSNDLLDDELFRDLTLTDSSVRSLLADSESSSSSSNSLSQDSSVSDWNEMGRTWRSPQDERKRKMLEQRKEQWRAAKVAGKSQQSDKVSTCLSAFPQPSLLNPDDGRAKLERHVMGGSGKVSRCNSQRCPTLHRTASPLTIQVPNSSTLSTSANNNLITTNGSVSGAQPIRPSVPWTGRQGSSPVPSPTNASPSTWAMKRFGRHVGPARNPDCSCTHCLDHFARLRSTKDSGRMRICL